MTQVATPAADLFNSGGWVASFDNPLYLSVKEQSDNEWINSEAQPSSSVYVTELSELIDPEGAEGNWTIKLRLKKMAVTATQLNLTVELRQFYVDESDPGELIHTETIVDVPDTLTDYEFVVPDTSFVALDNPLSLRVVADTI